MVLQLSLVDGCNSAGACIFHAGSDLLRDLLSLRWIHSERDMLTLRFFVLPVTCVHIRDLHVRWVDHLSVVVTPTPLAEVRRVSYSGGGEDEIVHVLDGVQVDVVGPRQELRLLLRGVAADRAAAARRADHGPVHLRGRAVRPLRGHEPQRVTREAVS